MAHREIYYSFNGVNKLSVELSPVPELSPEYANKQLHYFRKAAAYAKHHGAIKEKIIIFVFTEY